MNAHRHASTCRTFRLRRIVIVCATAAVCGAAWHAPLARAQSYSPADDAARSVRRGRVLFTRVWQPRASDGKSGDGLGPLFNERSCAACHKLGGVGGAGPAGNNVQVVTVGTFKPEDPEFATQPLQRRSLFPTADVDSFVLHRFGVAPQYSAWRTSRLALVKPATPSLTIAADRQRRALFDEALAAMRRPAEPVRSEVVVQGNVITGRVVRPPVQPTTDSDDDDTPWRLATLTLEERNTPAIFGAGLLESVTPALLDEVAERQPAGIRGRPAKLPDGDIGRFGWKAQNTTLLDFNENACAVELGLETPTRHQVQMPAFAAIGSYRPEAYDAVRGIDVTADDIRAMTDFTAALPAPQQRIPRGMENVVEVGEQLFEQVGCATCHVRDLGLARSVYSDLLLHRMGGYAAVYYATDPNLPLAGESPSPTAPAAPDEFRTPPLWGVADSAPYMHDGAAATLHEAILAHGVQGAFAGQKYRQLNADDQRMLVVFLETLRAP